MIRNKSNFYCLTYCFSKAELTISVGQVGADSMNFFLLQSIFIQMSESREYLGKT